MEIKLFRSIENENMELIIDSFRFSYLMLDAGERKEAVFCTVSALLKNQNGCFFTILHEGNKIAYGTFTFGKDDSKVRRLAYFAVEREFRNNGLGKQALALAIDSEVSIDHGCILACKPELKGFYEKLGFVYSSPSVDKNDEIIMVYNNPEVMDIDECSRQIVHLVKILPTSIDIFSTVKRELRALKIRPPKQ